MKERDPVRVSQETRDAIADLFFDMYGIPLSWATKIAEWDTPLGHRWAEALGVFTDLIIDPVENGDMEVL